MTDTEAEEAFLNSVQVGTETTGDPTGENHEATSAQIEPSVEYDPAHHVQDSSLPASSSDTSHPSAPSNTVVERPRSAQQQAFSALNTPAMVEGASSTIASPLDGTAPTLPASRPSFSAQDQPPPSATSATFTPRQRLAHDTVGILEDRIKEDPKGDTEAWLSVIEEHKAKGRFDDARKVYDRFLTVFPQAADQWVAYLKLEDEYGTRGTKDALLPRALNKAPSSLQLWHLYLDHVRRYFPLNIDGNSQIVHRAFQEVVKRVGIDKNAGQIWIDYIAFTKSGPGVIGGNSWVDGQKMDQVRKVYQQAICVPTDQIETIWKEYSAFEMGLNKLTGRKFLQERSPDYMTARGSTVELRNITYDLSRTTLPSLPPALGFDGDVEYMQQVDIWKKWIQWEKNDPLVLKESNMATWKQRVTYAYKQALMALRFWPETWFDAAEFCFENDLENEGNEFLDEGIAANPESCLLAFKKADRVELTTTNGNDEDSKEKRGQKVREPYEHLLDELYRLLVHWTDRETADLAHINAAFPEAPTQTSNNEARENGDADEDKTVPPKPESRKAMQIQMVKAMTSVQKSLLSRTITHAWIALMRAFQRMQGKGNPKAAQIRGSRGVFTDARRRGRFTSEVWVAAAMLEYHTNDSDLANKLFDRAMKLFPEDETLALQYVKWLTSVNDHTNARVTFEKAIQTLSKPETIGKTKPLYAYFHRYESQYGELAAVVKLEKRMRDAFPTDPKLSSFASRFITDKDTFDPTAIRPLVSPKTQARPRPMFPAQPSSIQAPTPPAIVHSPPLVHAPAPPPNLTNSPKRPFPTEDFDDASLNPPRKIARGESPLAGAAGRRLDNIRRSRQPGESSAPSVNPSGGYPPPTQPPIRDILFLLSIIPPASSWPAEMMQLPPDAVVKLLGQIQLPESASHLPARPPPTPSAPPQHYGQPPPMGYPGAMYNR